MLLETLDLRHKDILIYSENIFDFNYNFKIIFKNSKIKRPNSISFFEVCSYVKDPSPKNLIIYRLQTNVNDLDAYSSKYGYFIKIGGEMELIYFDPVFAIKDLRHLHFELDPKFFRFKIQQVGLTSLTKWESEPDFAEVYSFDLKAAEAQNQNDKIFADAIFALDEGYSDDDSEINEEPGPPLYPDEIDNIDQHTETIDTANIAEDKSDGDHMLNIPAAPDSSKASDKREEIISALKQALKIPDERKTKIEVPASTKIGEKKSSPEEKHEVTLFDLFKTTNKSNELSQREKENVILKFDKK
jgi:hypothetical protein